MQSETKDVELEVVNPGLVEDREIEIERPPQSMSLDETGAGTMAHNLIRILDQQYTKEQVYAIACWMKYLSTQD